MAASALVVCYSQHSGGAERILAEWAPALWPGVTVASPPGPVADAVRAAGLAWHPIRPRPLEVRPTVGDRLRAAARLASHAREISRLRAELRPAVLVAWGMPSLVSAALAWRRPPALVFVHVDVLPQGPMRAAVVRAARRCERVVALSADAAAEIERAARLDGRAVVVHPGIDLQRFAEAPWPEPPRRVVLSGAIVGWKRPDLALEIVARATRELEDLRLDVLGAPLDADGERLLVALRERASRPDLDGRVRFLGRLADPRSVVADAHVLLHCADREPFGLVVPEALALGRPVVAPAAGGPAEVVTPSCGALYASGEAEAGAAQLVGVLRDLEAARALGAAGRRRVEQEFTLDGARERFRAAALGAGQK